MMIDFSSCKINKFKYYGGKNGHKKGIYYEKQRYMLKFPSLNPAKGNSRYTNSCFSEDICCRIFNFLGIPAQKTLLGTYQEGEREKIVVACKDFEDPPWKLQAFAELKNACVETSQSGYGTELSEVLNAVSEQMILDPLKLKEFFWDMFIADALVGNFDRHNGNWGFLVNEQEETAVIAPVYDCGSCLYPQLSDENIAAVLRDKDEIDARIFVFPASALKIESQKINYADFIIGRKCQDCNRALRRIYPRIDMDVMEKIVDDTPYISAIRKRFYKSMLRVRKECILEVAYDALLEDEIEALNPLPSEKRLS